MYYVHSTYAQLISRIVSLFLSVKTTQLTRIARIYLLGNIYLKTYKHARCVVCWHACPVFDPLVTSKAKVHFRDEATRTGEVER